MSDHILLAYALDGDGTGERLTDKEIGAGLKDENLAWVHLDANHKDTCTWLEAEISYLDPFVTEALLAEETRPRITQIDDGAIVILRGVNFNEGEDPEDMVSIRLFIDENRIISVQRRDVRAVNILESYLKAGRGPKDAGQFICKLIGQLTERFESVLTDLDDLVDKTEETVLETANTELRRDIVDIRKKSILFRRHLAPQRDAISQLRTADLDWLDDTDRRYLLESFNHIIRYVEELDAIRERAQIVKDELASLLADRMNRNTYVLSVIAAIFLPLGFLTGLFGINIGGMPGVENGMAFLIFCLFLAVLVPVQIWLFKKLNWF